MTKFLRAIGVRIFDYPQLASTLRDRVRERAASLARKPQPAQTVWQPGSMEWLAEQNKPNEPPPLRRLLALVETRELPVPSSAESVANSIWAKAACR